MARICVFAGSELGTDPAFAEQSRELGQRLAAVSHTLVCGGAAVGLMKACSEGANLGGATVEVVVPEFFLRNQPQPAYVKLTKVASEEEQQDIFRQTGDAFILLPGAFGTMYETVAMASAKQYGRHQKMIVAFSINGYWELLSGQVEHMQQKGMLKQESPIFFARTVEEVLGKISHSLVV